MIDAWTSVHDQNKLGVTYNIKRPYSEATHIDNLLVSFWHFKSDIQLKKAIFLSKNHLPVSFCSAAVSGRITYR